MRNERVRVYSLGRRPFRLAMTARRSMRRVALLLRPSFVLNKADAMTRHLDDGTSLTIIVTFVLFVLALSVKGLTHDLLLGTGS
jgi:hypothetical protein